MDAADMDTADLEIGLHRRDAEDYQLELRLSRPDSPTDDRVGPTTPVPVQFDPARLRSLMLNAAAYGKLLGESLFATQELRMAFSTTRKVVESHNWALRIRLFIAPGASELQSLRWETLRDPSEDRCLLTAEQLLFSRYLSSSDWRPVERRPRTDLRALLVIANPSDIAEYNMASLSVVETLDRAKSGFGNIPVTELASGGTATLENVITQLREDYDILYLICHGMLVENEPWLWLEAASGETQRVPGMAFCTRLKELKHRPRLVVLASCQSAGTGKATSPREAGALTALGPRLAEAGIPAVIAMQGNISINTIDAFMPVFFRELQCDGQIDRAMSVARGMVRERFDWWMPVLFMRLKDGRLWDIPRSEKGSEKEPISKKEPIFKKEPPGIMKLTGQQYKQLQQALLDAFPTETALQQLVMFELDENLAAIASGGNLQDIVFRLIGWAQAQGRLAELIQGAMRSNPNNQALQQVANTLHISAPSPTSSPPPPPQEKPPIISQGDYFENVGGSVYTGPVTIHQGDIVRGDKVGGDKVGGDKITATVGDVSGGSQVAIGKGIQQSTTPTRSTQATSSPRPVPQDAPRVFICYAREDLALARRVYGDLKQAGVKPWMDSEDLLPGQNWKLVIKRTIKESKYLIALLSSRSLSKRGFVQKEMRTAWNVVDELPPEEIFIIPVRLDECTPMDERLQDLHHVDLFPSYEEGLQRILRVLIPPERMPEATPQEAQKLPAIHLRSEPTTVSKKEFKKVFRLDKEGRPREYIQNDYEAQGDVVVDHATGLMWQKSGADEPLTYEDAQKYIEELNRRKFAGNDWRLPTIPELMSLLEPTEKNGDLYIDPVFDTNQGCCWSADRLPKSEEGSSGAAWGVSFLDGYVGCYGLHYVRCVRSREPDSRQRPQKADFQKMKLDLQEFSFETVTVNAHGEIITREQHTARQYTEDLGNGVLLEMVYVPGGTFLMGSPETEKGHRDDESPQHKVAVAPFYMGKFPVTQEQWEVVMNTNPSNLKGVGQPVEKISWQDAVNFCFQLSLKTRQNYRLPSEAEWEYACRAGTTTPFYFGVTIRSGLVKYQWTKETYASEPQGTVHEETTEVGSFPPNAFGLYDMHGYVCEWCEDPWHENYQGAPSDGSVWESDGDKTRRLIRGGTRNYAPIGCRSASRAKLVQDNRNYIVGLRVVRNVST